MSQSNDSKECRARRTEKVGLLSVREAETYQCVNSFRHETSGSRNRILNSDQHVIRECSSRDKVSSRRINQSRCICISRTVSIGLDGFSESTRCCWRNIHDFPRRWELTISWHLGQGAYTAETRDLIALGIGGSRGREQQGHNLKQRRHLHFKGSGKE